jgi:hypothetical protein
MADVQRLLNQASGKADQAKRRIEEEEKENQKNQSPAEDAARLQALFNWRTSTITQEMFTRLGNRAKQLEEAATTLACNGFTDEERIKVTHLLIKALAFRSIIKEFAQEETQ